MDILPFTVPQLQVAINCLLDVAGDKDEAVRENVSSSLRRIAKKYAVHVLQNAVAYRQKNPKLSVSHLTAILTVMELICEEQGDQLDDIVIRQLSVYCVDEMTRSAEYLPAIQFPVSNTLVALGQKNCPIVMGDLITKLHSDTIPHYTVMHTLANLASANVAGFVPFIKAILDMMLPLMPTIRNDPIRQVFSFALGKFSEAILEFLSTQPQGESGDITISVTKDAFTDEITTAYEILLTSWLHSRESKIVENVVVAVGPMYPLVCEERQSELAHRTVSVLLNLYRRSQPPAIASHPVTQCLASILQAAPTSAIEPLYDQLSSVLGVMVVTPPDYTNPQTVKNHSEVLRCYDRLGCHFPERMADLLVRQLASGSERDRVEALIVAAHLLSGSENVLQARVADIVSALRLLLSTNSVKIKKALVKAIVSLACKGNADDGSDFVEFLVRHCCPSSLYSGPEWEELTAMCCSTVYLLSTTVTEVQHLLWVVLLRLLLIPEYDAACSTVARSLAHLAAKQVTNGPTQNGGVPSPPAVFTRCIALLGSPLNSNRGPHLLTFLMHYCCILQPMLSKLWAHKIPQLINYLEVSEWSESQWEALLLEFVSSSLQAADSEDWVILVSSHLSAQLVRNAPTSTTPPPTSPFSDERGMLLKCLALASCCLSDRQIITSHLDVMLSPLRHYSVSDSKACARGVGLLARVHLNLVLTRLEAVSQSELSRRSSRLLGLMKDPRADLEVERARVALLRCYGEVATQAPASTILPRLDDGLMAWLIAQLALAKDTNTREVTLMTLANMADTLDRHRDTYTENLKSRDQLLTSLIGLIQSTPSPDPLTLRVTAAVVKLPPELSTEVRSNVLRTCFDRVFTSEMSENSAEERPPESNPVIKNLGILVEELLIDDVSLATLDDISTLLEPWLVQRNTQQRAAAVYILRTTLQAYYHHMTFGYEHPSKFSQAGILLGRSVLRCLDEDMSVRATALDCARLILLISAKYESLSTADLELSQAFANISIQDSCNNMELSKIVASKLPHNQLSHFADTLLRGLSDMEPTLIDSVSDILACFFQAKGGELYHHINDIIVLLLTRLAVVNPSSRGGAIKALLALARHHPKAVVNTLLAQPIPLHTSICDCWKALATDVALAADIFDQFLRLLKSTPLLNEDNPSNNRPNVAVLLPFAAISAMREMLLVAAMHELATTDFAEIFALLLTVFAVYVGVTPPIYTPASNKTVFIPNREAYKINPARVAQDCLRNFLLCSKCDAVAEAIIECPQIDVSNNFNYFLTMIPSITVAICASCGHHLTKILSALGHYSSSHYVAQRAAVTAFNSQCVELQCGGQVVLIDGVISSLLSSLSDSSALVRRLSLKGLANISYLDPSQRERHCESILDALIQGLDDHDAEFQGEVALQAMLGLSQVLPSVPHAHIRDIQVAVALRVKPFFDKDNVELRTMSLRLLGELAVTGGEALPGFQDQVRASLVCLLLHLRDPEPSVVKACKFSLRAASNTLEAEKTKAMLNQHLIDDASLHFQEFISDLAKLLVEEMSDQIPIMITTALGYGKSGWSTIRASSTIFIGALYSSSPSYVRERVSLEVITLRLQQQVKDPEKEVRSAASHAFSLLFIAPT